MEDEHPVLVRASAALVRELAALQHELNKPRPDDAAPAAVRTWLLRVGTQLASAHGAMQQYTAAGGPCDVPVSACSRWEGDRPSLRECANFGNVTLALGIAVEGDSLDGMRRDWSMERKVFDGDWSGLLEGALDSPSIIAGVL